MFQTIQNSNFFSSANHGGRPVLSYTFLEPQVRTWNVEKLCCDNIVKCLSVSKNIVLLQNLVYYFYRIIVLHCHCHCHIHLENIRKLLNFGFFQEKQNGIIDLKWFTFNRFLFHLGYSTYQEFSRFSINSVDSLLTHLGKASLSNFASNLK